MMHIEDEARSAIFKHAQAEYESPAGKRESCGLIVLRRGRQLYRPCKNIAEGGEHFAIDPEDYVQAEDEAHGDVLAVVHSHPDAQAIASQGDLVGCERSGLPWVTVSFPVSDLQIIEPSQYEAPLIGRQFVYGVLDCYTLVQDWYKRELGIDVPPPPVEAQRPLWWKRGPNGEAPADLYLQGYAAAGFMRIEELQPGDVILMQIEADVANHSAIYLGEQLILHHLWGRLSGRDIWGGYWMKHSRCFVRHQSMVKL